MKIALAQMKMTPEIQLTPFFPQFKDENVSDYVMTIDDPYVEGICRACRKNRIFASPNIYIEPMQQLPEKRNPTHHLESRNYILNVRDISRNNDNAAQTAKSTVITIASARSRSIMHSEISCSNHSIAG